MTAGILGEQEVILSGAKDLATVRRSQVLRFAQDDDIE
jgi:hypothetical protein